MAEAISQSDDYKVTMKDTKTLKEWMREWLRTYKVGYVKNRNISRARYGIESRNKNRFKICNES